MNSVVLSAKEVDDASWSSMVTRREVGGGSARQMSVMKESPRCSRGSGTAEEHVATTSSGLQQKGLVDGN